MTRFDRADQGTGRWTLRPSGVVWNTVVPLLGLALLLGAAILPAFAAAAAASLVIYAVLTDRHGGTGRPSPTWHVAGRRPRPSA
jgi:hypothetical protein